LGSLTKSISSLKVSQNSDKSKQHPVQKFMTSATIRHQSSKFDDDMSKQIFTDLSPIHISHKIPFNNIKVQHIPVSSVPQVDSMLSAPPPWKLYVDKPVDAPLTIGYSAFLTLHQ
jgi:hypothetical protein